MPKFSVIIDYSKMQENELLTFSSNVANKLIGNPNFKFEPSVLTSFSGSIEDFNIKLTLAEQGTSHDVAQKNAAKEIVCQYLNEIGMEVHMQAKGDTIKLQSSGLILTKEPRKVGVLPKPTNLRVVSGANSGELLCSVDANPDTLMYNFYWAPVPAPADIMEWRLSLSTTRKKNIAGFIPGKQYEIKCAYQGTADTLVYSDPIKIFAQ